MDNNADLPQVVLVCDPGADGTPDPLFLLAAAQYLTLRERIVLRAVVVNRVPATRRAFYARSALDRLPRVPLGIGADVGRVPYEHPLDPRFTREADDALPAHQLLHRTLVIARTPVDLVVTSPPTDVAALARSYPDLVADRVRHVTIFGGAAEGDMFSDKVDPAAARYLYGYLRDRGIRTSVIPASTASELSVPGDVLREIGRWGDGRAVWLARRALMTAAGGSPHDPRTRVPAGALLALIEAMRVGRGKPRAFVMAPGPLSICRPGGRQTNARLIDYQVDLLYNALLAVDETDRRATARRLAEDVTRRTAAEVGADPGPIEVAMDGTLATLEVRCGIALRAQVARGCEAEVAGRLDRVLGGTPVRVTVAPTR